MTMNCFEIERKKNVLENRLLESHRKLFYAYADKDILNVLKTLRCDLREYKEGNFSIKYDKELKTINFYVYEENGLKKDLFANISITPKKGKKYLYYLGDYSLDTRDDFLNTLTINKLKEQIAENYSKNIRK